MDAAGLLREAALIGPFFAVEPELRGGGWQPFRSYLEDETQRRERVGAARAMLARRAGVSEDVIDAHATASIQHLGTVARIVSPLLAVSATHGLTLAVTPETLHWRAVPGGPVEFAMTTDAEGRLDAIVGSVVAPLGDAFARTWRLSPHTLRGNVASAVAGACGMLARARPDLAAAAEHDARALLGTDYLRGSARWPARGSFRRTNCCLFYRIPGAGICGDCVLDSSRSASGAKTTPITDQSTS